MHKEQSQSPSIRLGEYLRQARKSKGYSLVSLAESIGRPREWLNRVELGYSQYGEYKPPTDADLQSLINVLGDSLPVSANIILQLGREAEEEYKRNKRHGQENSHKLKGKITHTEVILGEQQIVHAITSLIEEQYSDAVIRNTGIKGEGGYLGVNADWRMYRQALGEFLQKNPNALFKRIEFVTTPDHIKEAKEADAKLAGNRDISEVHNAKIKFKKINPMQMHVVIGQREAIIALPPVSGKAGSTAALLIRDKIFVDALRSWYDEVLWDGNGEYTNLNFKNFDESFSEIAKMYGFEQSS